MFVRTKTTPNSKKTAIQLVSNERVGGKVKQKIVRHFGYAINDDEIRALKRLAEQYKQTLIEKCQPTLFGTQRMMDMFTEAAKEEDVEDRMLVDLKKLREKQRIKVGIHQLYGNIFDELGLVKCVKGHSRKFAAMKLLRNIVLARIYNPKSKRATVRALADDFGLSTHLTYLYAIPISLGVFEVHRH